MAFYYHYSTFVQVAVFRAAQSHHRLCSTAQKARFGTGCAAKRPSPFTSRSSHGHARHLAKASLGRGVAEATGMAKSKDVLFLLPPGFLSNGRREYCPECAELWGLLSYYPAIKESVDIRYQELERPRAAMVDLLGERNQNCPTLALAASSPGFDNCGLKEGSGPRFLSNARDIGRYYAQRFGTAIPRGSGPL